MTKNYFLRFFAILFFALCSLKVFGQGQFWRAFTGNQVLSVLPMEDNPSVYKIFTLNQNAMEEFLSSLEEGYENARELHLPAPDGSYKLFKVWRSSMMEPELAAKYPEIQTFTAELVENPAVTAKISHTYYGFRAMIFDYSGHYVISQYNKHERNGYFVVYNLKDDSASQELMCEFTGDNMGKLPSGNDKQEQIMERRNGDVRKVYKLAIACTGEWGTMMVGIGGSVAQMLSLVTEIVNNANGIYQRELAISFELVAANDLILFSNSQTDPYSCNTILSCLLSENQNVIDARIGNANYHVGHILTNAGGGLALLKSACRPGEKASGASTVNTPNLITTFIHELGHQFGADHTFSAESGGCANNVTYQSAYEPGSGSTYMSYLGLCAPNNIQNANPTTDPIERTYFHAHSLNQISSYIYDNEGGCGTTITGMSVVNAQNVHDTFFVPKGTPLEFIAPLATAANVNETILYNIEQFDSVIIGPTGNPNNLESKNPEALSGPLFRSFPPSTNRTITFPSLPLVAENKLNNISGQRVPLRPRIINMKVTTRGMRHGWGNFNTTDGGYVVAVTNDGPFDVISQDSPTIWLPGTIQTIRWDVGGTNAAPINCGYVNIYLSLDGGHTFPFNVVSNAPNKGSYDYTVPDIYVEKARVMVKGSGSIFFDTNKADFKINGKPSSIDQTNLLSMVSIFPNPATQTLHVHNKDNSKNLNIVIFNLLGQRVWEGNFQEEKQINVASFARGMYVVQISDFKNGTKANQRLLLQ